MEKFSHPVYTVHTHRFDLVVFYQAYSSKLLVFAPFYIYPKQKPLEK